MVELMEQYFAQKIGLSQAEYDLHVACVRDAIKASRDGKIKLVVALYQFRAKIHDRYEASFMKVCSAVFRLDKTQVSRYISIVEEFGNVDRTDLAEAYKDYSISVLTEMLSLSFQDRKKVSFDWTVRDVRELKKILAFSSDADEEDEKELPPNKYSRFEGWKRYELCDRIFSLEEELRLLRKE